MSLRAVKLTTMLYLPETWKGVCLPVATQPTDAIEVFISYSHRDEDLKNELVKHLANLERQGVITGWHDRKITAGQEWAGEINEHLDTARVILLLISPDFMSSDYCNDVELKRAMARHEAGEARVIPVVLRPVDWESAPFSKLQMLPTDAKPVTLWQDRDEAFVSVVKEIRKALKDLAAGKGYAPLLPDIPRPSVVGFVVRRDRDGREIVARLKEELAPQKYQLVTLWGAGGVGKTTLAAEAAQELAGDFEQRVVWVTADTRDDLPFTTFLDEIAKQLGEKDLRKLAPEQKAEAVRALVAAAPTLIVLDNFETISEAERAQCLDFLAQRAHCSALITTRQRIEHVGRVLIDPMSPDEAEEFLQLLIKQTRDPDIFAEHYRKRLIQTAEANPLIMEWIAGQIDLANDPEEVLDELKHGEGEAAHHVFDRSFNLPQLNDGGRAVLLALSLFTPSAGRPTLAAVAGMNLGIEKDKKRFKKAQGTLSSLWLIKQVDGGHRLAVAGLTRELTKARLATENTRAKTYRQRFVSHFLRYAQARREPTAANFNALEEEKDNLLSAMDVAFESGDWQSLMRLVDVLATPEKGMLSVRGYWDETIRRGEQAVAAARAVQDEYSVATFAGNVAIIREHRGQYDAARQTYKQVIEVFRQLNEQRDVAIGFFNLASIAKHQGEFAEARRLYDESVEIFKKFGDENDIANPILAIGSLLQEQGNLAEARKFIERGISIGNKLGNQSLIALSLHHLGVLHFAEKDYVTSERLLLESLSILRRLGDKQNISECLESIGKLRLEQGRLPEAEGLLAEALGIAEALGLQFGIGSVKHSLGLLAEKRDDVAGAARLLREAVSIFEQLGSYKTAEAQQDLARVEGQAE